MNAFFHLAETVILIRNSYLVMQLCTPVHLYTCTPTVHDVSTLSGIYLLFFQLFINIILIYNVMLKLFF